MGGEKTYVMYVFGNLGLLENFNLILGKMAKHKRFWNSRSFRTIGRPVIQFQKIKQSLDKSLALYTVNKMEIKLVLLLLVVFL